VKDLLVLEDGEGRVSGIRLESGESVRADAVVVATGGYSYRTTGSTGDGYRFARETGHTVTDLSPSLVPMETADGWAQQMQGLSLRNVEVTILDGKKELYREFGEMMFTHFGVTGPLILTASTVVQKKLKDHPLQLYIDLKPALSEEQLDARLLREFEAAKNKQLKNVLGSLYPAKLLPVMIERSGISGEKVIHDISREERRTLLTLTKHFPLTLTGLRDYNEAIITRGGVSVRQIQPGTMESKVVPGLYFAGEVLDLDAVTGGYNLQIAWATGHLAGEMIP
jgi:predicted Rossmann fold flavoprotein